jgi:hypothetical protein
MGTLPTALFKYVGPDRIDIITTLRIRFTPPSRLNDPFDVLPSVDPPLPESVKSAEAKLTQRMYEEYALQQRHAGREPVLFKDFEAKQAKHNRPVWQKLEDPVSYKEIAAHWIQQRWNRRVGVLSLTEQEKEPLMWSHYTRSHEGMVIEFDPRHPFFGPHDPSAKADSQALIKVRYSNTRPKMAVGSIEPGMFNTKSSHWEYEREWRIFALLDQSDARLSIGDDTVHLFNLPPKAIKRVVMGLRMEPALRAELAYAVRKNPDLRHTQIQEAKLDPNHFDLHYAPFKPS